MLPDSWSFRQKPSGAFKWVLRLPIHLFHWRLGFIFGDRLLLLAHRGRRSGRIHETAVEVVEHDEASGEYVVCSGTGPTADWYRNICAENAVSVQVRNERWIPSQRLLDNEEAAARFARYESAHPRTARRLLAAMGNDYDGTNRSRIEMMSKMPMIAFSDTHPT